ncbi:MAG: glycosyl transferase family 2, partial [Acidobacteria bacterium]|nr:glycosyl transferase family 2 [Acidobacteriota bacterium]
MPQTNPMTTERQREIEALGSADIVVGVATHNNVETIGNVIQAAVSGLQKYCPSHKSVLIHADGGSEDGTVQAVREAVNPELALVQVSYSMDGLSAPAHGLPGQANAIGDIFQLAQKLGAKVCVLVGGNTENTAPEWMQRLTHPVLEKEYDFVIPCFRRHKYDAAIINSIVYPMLRALYGKRVRQPVGSDFAISSRLLQHYLTQRVHDSAPARCSVDIWLVVEAICSNFSICQVFLGDKLQRLPNPAPDASAILAEVLGALFMSVEKTPATWQKVRASEEVLAFGSPVS